MRELSIAASLFSAVVLAAAPGGAARAADLSEPPAGYDREYDQSYDDRGAYDDRDVSDDDEAGPPPAGYREHYEERYSERYGEAPPPDADDRYDAAPPPPGSIKDGYPVPVEPPRYGDRAPERYDRDRYACLEPYQIDHRLHARGWIDVRPMGSDGAFVRIQARRPDSSSVFVLRVDRCSGEVASSRPIRTFAYAPRPWHRWHRWGD